MNHYSAYARFKSAAKRRKASAAAQYRALGTVLMSASVIALYCALFPSGLWGVHIKGALTTAFGLGSAVVPVWTGYLGLRLALKRPWPQATLRVTLGLGVQFFALCFLSLFSQVAYGTNAAGIVGLAGSAFLSRLFGIPGAWLVSLIGTGLAAAGLFRVSPIALAESFWDAIQQDLQHWQAARKEAKVARREPVMKAKPLPAPAAEPIVSKPVERPAPTVVKPPKIQAAPELPFPKSASKPEAAPAQSSGTAGGPIGPETPAAAPPEKPYVLPPLGLLADPTSGNAPPAEGTLVEKARILEQTLANFGVEARTTDIHPGPVITRFDLEPAPGVKISSIVNLADDIALAMKATRVRVLAPIPGKGAVGVEIPNPDSVTVTLKEILGDPRFMNHKSPLMVALGKTSSGEPYVTDLAPMPHLLVAGATGTGKSVCIHTLIMSILMRTTPERVKFVLIDPKRLELPFYEGMPHLYDPRVGQEGAQVITQPKEAAKALQRLVQVMEHRYEVFASANVRNIEAYNEKRAANGLPPEFYIVVIIDELADLMLTAAREVEDCIQRLAQMARAVGIHLVLATQRPSVDVITGVIKANLPARIALRVASLTDSRVILDVPGAESLVGRGDMLFLPAGAPAPIRLQGAYVAEKEVEGVVKFAKDQRKPNYEDLFAKIAAANAAKDDAETRQQLDEALRLVMERKRVSQDLLKAHFGSSARATNVLSLLEVKGFIHKPDGTNKWDIYFDKIDDYFRATPVKAAPAEPEV